MPVLSPVSMIISGDIDHNISTFFGTDLIPDGNLSITIVIKAVIGTVMYLGPQLHGIGVTSEYFPGPQATASLVLSKCWQDNTLNPIAMLTMPPRKTPTLAPINGAKPEYCNR
jgi:hypothetical protein